MGDKARNKEEMATRAEEAFKSVVRRDTASKEITEAEHATAATKTAKLRTLRLAKEAADATNRGSMAHRRKRR